MKSIELKNRNLTINEITKLELDTVGRSLILDENFIPFKTSESKKAFENLIDGRNRDTNREQFVFFEGRLRDTIEKCIRKIIPNNLSTYAARIDDKPLNEFLNNQNNNLRVVQEKGHVQDYITYNTDWLHFLSSEYSYKSLPESLSEKIFIDDVFSIFSYELIPLRVNYHKDNETIEDLVNLINEVSPLLRIRLIDSFQYLNNLEEITNNIQSIDELKKEFKSQKDSDFETFEEYRNAIHSLFEIYKNLCSKLYEYEAHKKSELKKRIWPQTFYRCGHKENHGEHISFRNEEFIDALETLRSPKYTDLFTQIMAPSSKLTETFLNEGVYPLIQKFNRSKLEELEEQNEFINSLINLLSAITDSDSSEKEINNYDSCSIFSEENDLIKEDSLYLKIKIIKANNTYGSPLYKIADILQKKVCELSKDAESQLWGDFLGKIIGNRDFSLKEEQKTKGFILFQNKQLIHSHNSAFQSFFCQLTGIYEYKGFSTCISIAMDRLEKFQKEPSNCYRKNKSIYNFLKENLIKIKQDIDSENAVINTSPFYRHSEWFIFLRNLSSKYGGIINLSEWPEKEVNSYVSDGSSTKSLNKKDLIFYCDDICKDFNYNIGLKDLFSLYEIQDCSSNSIFDRYQYEGLVEQNPYLHSKYALFYKFLYGFFSSLKKNVIKLNPTELNQSQILEYSLSSYVASYVRNPHSYQEKPTKENRQKWTKAKLFVKKYFTYNEKKDLYEPSMKCSNAILRHEVEKINLKKVESLQKLANFLDTEHKGDQLINTPSTSSYVLVNVLENDSLFPEKLSDIAIRNFRANFLNYYLLCNFIKAIKPYFDENTEKIISKIVEGILSYNFYSSEKNAEKPVKSGFQYLLYNYRYEFVSHGGFIKYPDYFWYSLAKDDSVIKKLRKYSFMYSYFCEFEDKTKNLIATLGYRYSYNNSQAIDIELARKFAEEMREFIQKDTGEFYYNWILGRLEYYKYSTGNNSSLNDVVEHYEKAFKYIYNAGVGTEYFIKEISLLYGVNQFSKPEEKIKKMPLKKIWQWAEAFGLVDKTYNTITDNDIHPIFYNSWSPNPKLAEDIEKLYCELEKED